MTETTKIPGSAEEACVNALRPGAVIVVSVSGEDAAIKMAIIDAYFDAKTSQESFVAWRLLQDLGISAPLPYWPQPDYLSVTRTISMEF